MVRVSVDVGPLPKSGGGGDGRGRPEARETVEVSGSGREWDALLVHARGGGVAAGLGSLCEAALARLGAAGVAVSVAQREAGSATIAAAGALAREVEELQVTVGEGPSWEGLSGGGPLIVDDLRAAEVQARWPLFAPGAAAVGLRSLYVAPMGVGAARFAVFVVYLDRIGGLGDAGLAAAGTYAAVALDLLLEHPGAADRPGDPELPTDGLGFDDRPEIHQATGMIAVQLGVDPATALQRLRARAFADGALLSELAAEVVARRLRF